jgi:polyphosphate kinase
MEIEFRSKETSWLSFNARVLQEAADPSVPLFERIKFLGIYSSNLDEFFRVRVATLKRLISLGDGWKRLDIPDPNITLKTVRHLVSQQGDDFNRAYERVRIDLEKNGIRLIRETEVPAMLCDYLRDYFRREVSPHIFPIILKATAKLPKLKDLPMYLAVKASKSSGAGRPMHALIEIPQHLPRFIPLPKKGETQLVMYLDDIIRFGLDEVFATFPYDRYESYAIKFTRDSELALDDDFTESFYEKLADSIKAREQGLPVRANFDENFPKHFLNLILRKLDLAGAEGLYPGARYHNRRDLLGFPDFGKSELKYAKSPTVPVLAFAKRQAGMFAAIRKRDVLVHVPYQSFRHLITLLQEASIDPLVQSISMTQYRLAKGSCIARALQAAARNGKRVFVLVEPQARFDEEANIKWAGRYRDAGVQVQLGVQGLKVHSKLVHIVRRESGRDRGYTVLGTGNFNEDTASIFADHMLFTYDQEIGDDAAEIFRFFRQSYQKPQLKHLNIAPFDLRGFLRDKVEREIANHAAGKPAGISVKLNNFSDPATNALFHRAADEGVPVRLIVRSMYSLVVEDGGAIEAVSIVDKYLEHSRMLILTNGGEPEVYLSSADFMPRNFDTRVETIFPVYEPELRKQLIDYYDIQWSDNTKARLLDKSLTNGYRTAKKGVKRVRAQFALEDYLRGTAES